MAATFRISLCLMCLLTATVDIRGAGLDLTCFNNYPLLLPDDNDDAFIGGYKGGSNFTQINVDFSRTVDTGTGSNLPTGHSEGDYNNGRSRRLLMPLVGGIERIGAFNCIGEQNGESFNITAITSHSEGDPRAQQVTVTASLGDRVVFEVTRDDTSKPIRWSKDGDYISEFDDQTTVVIESVETDNGGIYDCYYESERSSAKQAIIRLIIRECPEKLWGPPHCSNACHSCYNGGVCDDKTGNCICAPGFGGAYCNQVFGRNTFGQEGDHHCKGSATNSSPGCRGRQLCALDPYGCSCPAGYRGRDCLTECDPGTYGADCKQTCHCADGPFVCEYATGTCTTGECLSGWVGDNCQVCARGVQNLDVSSLNSTSVFVTWTSPVNDANFVVEYKLTNIDQCQPETADPITLPAQSDTSVVISDLLPYSTYEIIVTCNAWPPCLLNQADGTHITDKGAPSQQPQNVRLSVQQETFLTFQWDPIPCGYRGGDDIMYEYSIDSSPPQTGTLIGTLRTIPNLEACSSYVFKIKAVNEAGTGPEASLNATTKEKDPDNVNGLTVTKIIDRPDQLHIEWNRIECTNTYAVYYTKILVDQCLDMNEPLNKFWEGDETSITITGLEAYTTYQVVVLSINSVGYGESSANGVTDIVAPTGSPENVTLLSKTNASLTFKWSRVACGQRGGQNDFMYTLFDQNGIIVENDTVSDLAVTTYNLEPCNNYSIKVEAFNQKGVGNPSVPFVGVTGVDLLNAQNLKTDQITSNTWHLSWNPENSSSCEIEEYLVEYLLTNIDQCEDIVEPGRTVFGYVNIPRVQISGLIPNSNYTAIVIPVNSYGKGPETYKLGSTLESVPTAPPFDLKATNVGTNYITYEWEDPPCGQRNGAIHEFQYSSSAGEEGIIRGKSLNVTGLNPCTEYTLSISAINNLGTGPAAIVSETTELEVPSIPTNLRQMDQDYEQMTIVWNPPAISSCKILSYTITRRTISRPYDDSFIPNPNPEETIEQNVTKTEHTFLYLQPSTEYEIQVCASAEAGKGDFSTITCYTRLADTQQYLGEPLPMPTVKGSSNSGYTVTIIIPRVVDPELYTTEFQILIEEPDQEVSYNTPDFTHKTYIAGKVDVKEVEMEPVEFVVGSGSTGGSNPPLLIGTHYIIYIGTCSAINNTAAGCIWSPGLEYTPGNDIPDTYWSILTIFLAIGSLLFVVSLLLVIVSLVYVKICRQNQIQSKSSDVEFKQLKSDTKGNNMTIQWSHVHIHDCVLGKGNFCEVRKGIFINHVNDAMKLEEVAVKIIKNAVDANISPELNKIKHIGHHANVVNLYGACENEGTIYLVMELISSGDLLSYLVQIRELHERNYENLPSVQGLLKFAYDVASGMDFLSKQKILNCNLAAKNILLHADPVTKELIAKVSRLGPSNSQDHVPIQWLALESQHQKKYTTESNVWSFAVLIWEIATLGETPYDGIESCDLLEKIKKGHRLPRPEELDTEVYELLFKCWDADPSSRPTFCDISQELKKIVKKDSPLKPLIDSVQGAYPVEPSQARRYEEHIINDTPYNWMIDWSKIRIYDTVLGKGEFGEVRKGIIVNDEGKLQEVAVKIPKDADKTSIRSEFNTMKRMGHHLNVVNFFGACENGGNLYLAMELASSGDLRSHLKQLREQEKEKEHNIPQMSTLLEFAIDVAKGMDHLAKHKIIHRDLAARNVLLNKDPVSKKLVAKVSDFGLSKFETYYVQTSKYPVPVRWLALESLCLQEYTTKSDVWSFAVLVWEIATLGRRPYPEIENNHDLSTELEKGYRMSRPKSLDGEVYQLMLKCWDKDPSLRPSFSNISRKLSMFVKTEEEPKTQHEYEESILTIIPDQEDSGNSVE